MQFRKVLQRELYGTETPHLKPDSEDNFTQICMSAGVGDVFS